MKVEFNRILCATDLSDFSNQVVYYGIAMARRFGAVLYFCHVIDLPVTTVHGSAYTFPEDYVDSLKEEALQKMEALMEGYSVEWEPIVMTGPVAKTLSGLVVQKKIELAIAATHGRSGLTRLLLGSVTERLVRSVGCPLLIAAPSEHKFNMETVEQAGFKNILVGCDFSPDSASAVNYALNLAQEFESNLHLVHVIEPIAYRDMLLPDPLLDNMQANLHQNLTEELTKRVPDEAHNWCEIKPVCLTGKVHEALIKHAEANSVDLIILGIRGRGLMESMLLGSTTDRVIRHAVCPVLSVCETQYDRRSREVEATATENA